MLSDLSRTKEWKVGDRLKFADASLCSKAEKYLTMYPNGVYVVKCVFPPKNSSEWELVSVMAPDSTTHLWLSCRFELAIEENKPYNPFEKVEKAALPKLDYMAITREIVGR